MDPLSGALAFSSVVSLLGQFRAERGAQAQDDFNAFLEWLLTHNHAELKQRIEGNTHVTAAIHELLHEQHDELMARLNSLDAALAAYASGVPGFAELGSGLRPQAGLSADAWEILRAFSESGATRFILDKNFEATEFIPGNGDAENIHAGDYKFLEDDLATLVELRLLRFDVTPRGNEVYILTRQAHDLVKAAE